jgi:putative phosphoesterase
MKIGFISDIHSNKIALKSVLEDMPTVDKLICMGDIIGYGPWPSDCVEIVQEECDLFVRGNHDRQVSYPREYKSNVPEYEGLIHSKAKLTNEQFNWVTTLPEQISIDDYLCVHSHPVSTDNYVYPSDFSAMGRYLSEYDGLVMGHTHKQGKETIEDGKLVFNPGSVGQPRDEDERAAYAVLDSDKNTVELRRTEYDIEKVINKINEYELPEFSGARLRKGL